MPSDIYKEALADAKKLREVAEADARNRLIEKVSPLISEMVTKKIKESSLTNRKTMPILDLTQPHQHLVTTQL